MQLKYAKNSLKYRTTIICTSEIPTPKNILFRNMKL